ncbi:unnamed protein product [Rotaria sp. Silwood2]|nr:unnamed protein product [Rotaria sp. Silwood2]CAF2596580.1 unnamed protein product [Rotaria sp. Silwood2]CAF3003871.1 unnamed protein product [Rotaria sp. Silwood2]CAF3997357.1 unnamed protein product [Rotaria sp. Silwood2]CAF4251406.1 unnamed protein product [Rotaria sp. Silwood2]
MCWFLIIGLVLFINKSMGCTVSSFSNLAVQRHFNLKRFLGLWYEPNWYTTQSINPSSIWNDYSQSFELQNGVS